jgi:hypothetical protein
MSWRDAARPRIAAVIERVGRSDMVRLRKALREAFPWGQRRNWPYKIWRDECNEQLGVKQARKRARLVASDLDAGQKMLFGAESK